MAGVHGIRGSLKIRSYAESLSVYEGGTGIRVALPDGSVRRMTVQWMQPHGRVLLMTLDGVADRDMAESLIGSELYVERACLPTLEEDTYYWSDLVGLRVYDTSGVHLGCLDEIIPTPGNDVYVVRRRQDGQTTEMLIPAIGDVVLKIDLENRTMLVDPPEGL